MKGHIRQRGKNSWALVIDLGKGPDGKRRQKWHTVHGGKRKAEAELRRLLSELDNGTYVEPSAQSIGAYLTDWLTVIQPRLSPKTFARYDEIVRLHLIPAFGSIELQKLNGIHLETYYANARVSGRADGKGGLSEQTLLHHHRVLSKAMKRAVRLKLRAGNPCADIEAPKPIRKEVAVLNERQTMALLQAAAGSRLYAPVLVAVTTGLRLGELLALRWEDIDPDGAELSVYRTLQRVKKLGLIVKELPKTRTSRRKVALPPVTVNVLRTHLAEQKKERLRLGPLWEDSGLVFPAEDGSPWGPDSLSHQFSRLAHGAGFDLTFHGLRHTHATHLLRAGVSAKVASSRLGHSGIGITLDLYSHVLKDAQEEAASRIDAVFRDALKK